PPRRSTLFPYTTLFRSPNCHCFDPNTTLVLNPAAWTDAAPGQFGTAAAYYNDYRWQRQPAESLSFGRTFREKRRKLQGSTERQRSEEHTSELQSRSDLV